MRKSLLALLCLLMVTSVCQAAIIYTLDFSFPVAGDHQMVWMLPDFPTGATGLGTVTTSEGQVLIGGGLEQSPTDLWIFFNFVTPAGHSINSWGTLARPGPIFSVVSGLTGTFGPISGGITHRFGPLLPDFELASSVTLSIQTQPIPEPNRGILVLLGLLTMMGACGIRRRTEKQAAKR